MNTETITGSQFYDHFTTNLTLIQSQIQVSGKYFLTVGAFPTEGAAGTASLVLTISEPATPFLNAIPGGPNKTKRKLLIERFTLLAN